MGGQEDVGRWASVLRREPLFEPFSSESSAHKDEFVKMVQSGVGVPIQYRRHSRRGWDVLRLPWILYFGSDTSPKPVFEIAAWEYRPVADLKAEGVYKDTGGSVLFVELSPGESGRHLKRSLRGKITDPTRVVVIATPAEMCDSKARVRRLEVERFEARTDDRCSKRLAFPATSAARVRKEEVPPGALWLLCASEEQAPPTSAWMEAPDGARTPQAVFDTRIREGTEHVQASLRRVRWAKVFVWALFGLGIPLLAWAVAVLVPVLSDFEKATWNNILTTAALWWLRVFVVVGLLVLLEAGFSWVEARCWRKAENMSKADWTGGTIRCLAARSLLGQLSVIGKTTWQDAFAEVWPNNGDSYSDGEAPLVASKRQQDKEESHWGAEAPLVASKRQWVGALFLDALFAVFMLGVGWLVWSLIIYGRGQTPAKQVLDLRVVSVEERRCLGWGQMAMREWIGKGTLVFLVVAIALGGVGVHEAWEWVLISAFAAWWLTNLVLLLVDERHQTAWDKALNTAVINDPARRFDPRSTHHHPQPDPSHTAIRAW